MYKIIALAENAFSLCWTVLSIGNIQIEIECDGLLTENSLFLLQQKLKRNIEINRVD